VAPTGEKIVSETTTKPLKAYKISCSDDDRCGQIVVFAETAKAARRRDRRDCDCPFIDISIRRAPSFDSLSPGPVTIAQYLEHDWYWTCSGCHDTCYGDTNPIINGDRLWCNLKCVERGRAAWPQDVSTYQPSVIEYCRKCDEILAASPPGSVQK